MFSIREGVNVPDCTSEVDELDCYRLELKSIPVPKKMIMFFSQENFSIGVLFVV